MDISIPDPHSAGVYMSFLWEHNCVFSASIGTIEMVVVNVRNVKFDDGLLKHPRPLPETSKRIQSYIDGHLRIKIDPEEAAKAEQAAIGKDQWMISVLRAKVYVSLAEITLT